MSAARRRKLICVTSSHGGSGLLKETLPSVIRTAPSTYLYNSSLFTASPLLEEIARVPSDNDRKERTECDIDNRRDNQLHTTGKIGEERLQHRVNSEVRCRKGEGYHSDRFPRQPDHERRRQKTEH